MSGGLYLYCLVPPGHAPATDVAGIDGAAAAILEEAGVGAWVSPLDERPAADLDAIRAHNRVVERAMTADVTPVPLRFGQWFPSTAAARAAIVRDAERWKVLLDRFAGAAEYGLRIAQREGAARVVHRDDVAGGAAYLRARARERAGALDEAGAAAVEIVRRRLSGAIRDERARRSSKLSGGVDIAHLVAHDHKDEYVAGVEALRAEQAELVFLSSGPWPPYSFVP